MTSFVRPFSTSLKCMFEYWSRPDIHTFGNVGFGGAVHAAMAPLATKVRIREQVNIYVDLRFTNSLFFFHFYTSDY